MNEEKTEGMWNRPPLKEQAWWNDMTAREQVVWWLGLTRGWVNDGAASKPESVPMEVFNAIQELVYQTRP
jgi:hypothetical protein